MGKSMDLGPTPREFGVSEALQHGGCAISCALPKSPLPSRGSSEHLQVLKVDFAPLQPLRVPRRNPWSCRWERPWAGATSGSASTRASPTLSGGTCTSGTCSSRNPAGILHLELEGAAGLCLSNPSWWCCGFLLPPYFVLKKEIKCLNQLPREVLLCLFWSGTWGCHVLPALLLNGGLECTKVSKTMENWGFL